MQRLYERVALTICAISLAAIAASSVAVRAGAAARDERFDELTVRRLRVVDASGATRLVLTGKPIPEGTIEGKLMPRLSGPRTDAGLMFYNDQGDEQGGLTYSGTKGEQGEGLTFDAWQQDQALEIQHGDGPSGSFSYIAGNELPTESLFDVATAFGNEYKAAHSDAERSAIRARYRREGRFGHERFLLGNRAGNSDLVLSDAQGHPRLRLRVTAAGSARLDFLDAGGAVSKSLTP